MTPQAALRARGRVSLTSSSLPTFTSPRYSIKRCYEMLHVVNNSIFCCGINIHKCSRCTPNVKRSVQGLAICSWDSCTKSFSCLQFKICFHRSASPHFYITATNEITGQSQPSILVFFLHLKYKNTSGICIEITIHMLK